MVKKVNSNTYENGDVHAIWGNSVTFAYRDFVSKSGWFLILATPSTVIEWVAKMAAVMASDNQTVAKKEVIYEEQKPQTTFEVAISGWTITIADEGKYYNLTDQVTVDWTTESTTSGQLQLVKFKTATKSLFKIVNKPVDLIS